MTPLAATVLAALALWTSATVAVAATTPNSPAAAQAAGDAFIESLIPSTGGQTGACDTKAQSGFFAKKASYLASCVSADGTLQVFSILDATNKSINTKSSYLKARLKTFCASGHAYASGVKRKFVNIYAGTGAGQGQAAELLNTLSGQIQESAGFVPPFKVC